MNSRERILAAWNGRPVDHVPLTAWCFGVQPPERLQWRKNGKPVRHWYSMRMEHLHTFPEPWDVSDDFNRVRAWLSLGVDDVLDVSVPWNVDPEVTWRDSTIPAGQLSPYPVLVREYKTPAGSLRHAVSKTDDSGEGWVVQPDHVPLFEDYNIPRAIEHAVASPADVPAVRHLYRPPDEAACAWFRDRMKTVSLFAAETGVAVQAWSAFGMDAVVWLMGTQGAILMAVDNPTAFGELVDGIAETDLARTELAASTAGVDMVVQRGWYSATDFWSPQLFDRFVVPHVREMAAAAHRCARKFGYCVTTGLRILGSRLIDAGVDVLYFIDPLQDGIALETARQLFEGRATMVGGINSLTLASGQPEKIREEVRRALDVLGPTNRFILHPVDAIFPDTPWAGVEALADAWARHR